MNNFAIGIPTLNRYDLLEEALQIYLNEDFPSTEIFLIDNGQQNINISHPNLTILTANKNLAVSASWNILMELIYQKHTHAFILNDDVYLGKKELDILHLINAEHYDFYVTTHNWCSFIVPEFTYLEVGGFDTDLPIYYSDNDYHYRMKLKDCSYYKTDILDPNIFRESMTIKKDPIINKDFDKDGNFYIQKWGGLPHHETFLVPFNLL